ncbi:MAG TPA: hypothetical protein VFI16_11190 [Anaeromyxobacteraceae bacterium]|nr:hypothetical protein [Anaeromyxobacteraceae bacterium]
MRTAACRALLLAILSPLTPAPARGSVVAEMDLAELCRSADIVIHGQVVSAESAWEGGAIATRSTVVAWRSLKGASRGQVVVRTSGGVVGGIGQRVSGEAVLGPGQEVLLFLEGAGPDFRPVGMARGAFRVRRDPATGAKVAWQDLDGLAVARPGSRGLEVAPAAPAAPVPLQDLLRRIERLVAAGAPAGSR